MRYSPIGDEVSVEGAILQAAQALDYAGKFAFDSRDTGTLLKVSESWKEVADFIVAFSEHEAKLEEKEKKVDVPLGFQPTPKDKEELAESEDEHTIIVEEEDNVRDSDDDS